MSFKPILAKDIPGMPGCKIDTVVFDPAGTPYLLVQQLKLTKRDDGSMIIEFEAAHLVPFEKE